MKLSLEEILTVIDKVSSTGLGSFSYQDQDIRIKIQGGSLKREQENTGKSLSGTDCGAEGSLQPVGAGAEAQSMQMEGTMQAVRTEEMAIDTRIQEKSGGQQLQGAEVPEIPQQEGQLQTCPMVGIFYVSDTERGAPLVQAGDEVKKGQVIGIIEAMKLMNEIRAEYDGIITEVLAENGQIVEYGQPLFRIADGRKG